MATINDNERAAWLAERRQGLGGSDIAKILGLSKWGGPADVWLDKRGQKEDQPESEAMRLGTFLEPFVAGRFAEASGKRIIDYKPMIHGVGERSFALANLDRIVVEDGQDINEMVLRLSNGDLTCVESILECKTATKMDDWHDEFGNFIVPEYYRCQVLHYLGLVPSAKRIYVAVYYTGLSKGFEFGCIERADVEQTIDNLFKFEKAWWDKHIMLGEMPAPANKDEVKELYPQSVPESAKKADAEIQKQVAAFVAAKSRADEAEKEMDEAADNIAKFMGDCEMLTTDAGIIATFKSGNPTVKDVTDWEVVAKACGATAEQIAAHTEVGKIVRKASRPLKVFDKAKPIKAAKKAKAA